MIFGNLGQQDPVSKSNTLTYRLWLALLEDVDVENFPTLVEATISSNVLRDGAVYRYLDAQINSINPNAEPGEAPMNQVLTLSPVIEGLSKQSLAWFYNLNGQRVIAVWERCRDKQKFIAGTPCSGGLLLSGTTGALENGLAGITITLTGGECPEPFAFYDGPVPLADPDIVPADATTFALTANSQYRLSENTADRTLTDITGITDDTIGRIIELTGAAISHPTKIIPSTKFILRNGVSFDALQGNKISFQIVKTGASSHAFYEVYRS